MTTTIDCLVSLPCGQIIGSRITYSSTALQQEVFGMSRHKHKEVNSLINKLTETAETVSSVTSPDHYLMPDIDLSPYKRARLYPGKEYILVGNSFNLEPGHCGSKRAVALAGIFERSTKGYVTVSHALASDEFNQVLSRFERDWLGRLSQDSLLSPAYNENGTLIGNAFSLWRPLNSLMHQAKVLEKV
jgi:hypothetical protein